jgi:hypothetical protein
LPATQSEQLRNESNRTHASTQGHALATNRKAWAKPAREREALAASRRTPKMHWSWIRRGRDILALLHHRFGSVLPDDDAGLDAAALLARHYLGLRIDAERVVRDNLRLWAPWLKDTAGIIAVAKDTKTPTAAGLGRAWKVTAEEVAEIGLRTVRAFTVTLEGDRIRQDRRRRKAGASTQRGRPKNETPAWVLAGFKSKATYHRHKAAGRLDAARLDETENASRSSGDETEIAHASSHIGGTERDEFQSHAPACDERRAPSATASRSDSPDAEMLGAPLRGSRDRSRKPTPTTRMDEKRDAVGEVPERPVLFGEIIPPGEGLPPRPYDRDEIIRLSHIFTQERRALERWMR